MSTEGFDGFYFETRDYAATSTLWSRLGFENVFETDHGSGQWQHPSGGPYVFIAEQHDAPLETHPILRVTDSAAFDVTHELTYAQEFTPQHWDAVEAHLLDPDNRHISLQAPVPAGVTSPDPDAHHAAKYR